MQWRKDSLFSKSCWENQTATWKRKKLEHFLTPYTNINSKLTKDLNIRPETKRLLGENIGSTLFGINHSKILFDPSPRVMEIKINKWDQIKLKSFCIAKEIINKMKRQLSEWEKIIADKTTDKVLISKIYKQLIQLNITKTNSSIKKMGKKPKQTFLQRRHVVVQSLSHVQLLATPWTAASQASLSFAISQSLLKLMSIELVVPSNHLILCHPLLLLQSFPASGIFQRVGSSHQVDKALEPQFQHQSFQWKFRTDFL